MGITPLDRAFFLERPLPFLLFLPVTSLGGGHACPFRWFGSRGWDAVWWGSCFASCGVTIRPGRVGVVVVDDGSGRCPEIRTWFVCAASSLVPRQGFLMSDRRLFDRWGEGIALLGTAGGDCPPLAACLP